MPPGGHSTPATGAPGPGAATGAAPGGGYKRDDQDQGGGLGGGPRGLHAAKTGKITARIR